MRGWSPAPLAAVFLAALVAPTGCAPALASRGSTVQASGTVDGSTIRRVPAPYSATLRILIRASGREASFRAGCAVDPARGARLEVRDPLGATRLLALLGDSGGVLLVDPARELESLWDDASETLPWVPDALRTFLMGPPPAGASPERNKGGATHFAWPSGSGSVKAALVPSAAGPAPYAEGDFRGPGRARLRLIASGVEPGELRPEVLQRPPLDLKATGVWDLLSGGAP